MMSDSVLTIALRLQGAVRIGGSRWVLSSGVLRAVSSGRPLSAANSLPDTGRLPTQISPKLQRAFEQVGRLPEADRITKTVEVRVPRDTPPPHCPTKR